MRRMDIEALYSNLHTSRRYLQHEVYPDLLRHLRIELPNQILAMDINYIPMHRGFIYLTPVIDWYSRKILSWRTSITMDVNSA